MESIFVVTTPVKQDQQAKEKQMPRRRSPKVSIGPKIYYRDVGRNEVLTLLPAKQHAKLRRPVFEHLSKFDLEAELENKKNDKW